jgi:hypothetical protein
MRVMNCIHESEDSICQLHSEGDQYIEPCIQGPCGDYKPDETALCPACGQYAVTDGVCMACARREGGKHDEG